MISSRWYKVLNDLWGHKLRTILIVLSIAVGLFAVGMIVSSRSILSTELAKSYAAINPSSGVVRTLELFDDDFVRSVRAMKDVRRGGSPLHLHGPHPGKFRRMGKYLYLCRGQL